MVRMTTRSNTGVQTGIAPVKVNTAPSKRVLIIDDESDICLLLSGLLRKLGYIPTCAQYIEEGRQCLQSQQYDAIFLDLNLPDGLGFDLLPIIRKDQKNARVIMISAFDGQAERRRAIDQGADFFVGKPFTRLSVEKALQST